MAGSSSKSGSYSTARTVLLGFQVRDLMGKLSTESEEFIDRVVSCVNDRLLKTLTFCEMDRNGDCIAKLVVDIDWEKNLALISQGRDGVNVGDKVVLCETTNVARAILDFIDGRNCHVSLYFRGTGPEESKEMSRRLNLHPANVPEIKGKKLEASSSPFELEELGYRLEMQDNRGGS